MEITFINNHGIFDNQPRLDWESEVSFTKGSISNYLVFVILGVGFIIHFYK